MTPSISIFHLQSIFEKIFLSDSAREVLEVVGVITLSLRGAIEVHRIEEHSFQVKT